VTVSITLVEHPIAADALATLRDETTDVVGFRAAMHRLSSVLLIEASRHLPTLNVSVTTPLASAPSRRLAEPPVIVPVLRAGLGMLASVLELLPTAEVGFVGISRDEDTAQPLPYVNKLPTNLAQRTCLVIDPMLATGGSLLHTCELLLERGAPSPLTVVCVLAAPEGIARLDKAGLDLQLVTAAIDDHLNERSFIVPGLGDAGDRLFGIA
jgi:uracil phosphoribosyltransferase